MSDQGGSEVEVNSEGGSEEVMTFIDLACVVALCAPNEHLTAPSNGDGAALAHRPWAYVGGAAAGHGEGRETARSAMVGPAWSWTSLGASLTVCL